MTETSKPSYTPTERTDRADREVLAPLDAACPERFKDMVRRLAATARGRKTAQKAPN